MTYLRRARRTIGWLLFAAAALGWFVYLRPPVLGGSTAYVFVRGTSMEPKYHTGDLVLVRRKARYAVGDIAAFAVDGPNGRQAVVIHRVIKVEPDGSYIFQGDNRDEPDPWHPTADKIVGTPIALLPAAGRWLADLAARPLLLGLLCGSLAGLMMLPGSSAPKPARPPRRTPQPIPGVLVELVRWYSSSPDPSALFVCGSGGPSRTMR
jgi:signal peptidase I